MQAHPTRRQAICGSAAQPAPSVRWCGEAARTQGDRGIIGCRDKRGRNGDLDVPFRILSVTTRLAFLMSACRHSRWVTAPTACLTYPASMVEPLK